MVFSDEDVVEPDLLYVARARLSVIGEKHAHGAPDLAVEVLSKSSRRKDLVLKRHLYESTGVGEYWIVDPLGETVQVFRAGLAGLRRVAVLSAAAGDTLESPSSRASPSRSPRSSSRAPFQSVRSTARKAELCARRRACGSAPEPGGPCRRSRRAAKACSARRAPAFIRFHRHL